MKVTTNSWHGRAYKRWATGPGVRWQWQWDNPHRSRENLCHYVRVILLHRPRQWAIYTPVRGSSWLRPGHLFALAILLLALVVGFTLAPVGTGLVVLSVLGAVVLSAATMGLLALGIMYKDHLEDKAYERRNQPRPSRGPTFRSVAWSWLKAKKRRICPFVDVVDPE